MHWDSKCDIHLIITVVKPLLFSLSYVIYALIFKTLIFEEMFFENSFEGNDIFNPPPFLDHLIHIFSSDTYYVLPMDEEQSK